ncbi:MAG: SulP family inorganic anion transporter [bacterium]|nr:SulP family inorganic anion transporter [bacterium]
MTNKLILRLFPFLAWLPISPLILRADLVAGITGALVLVPKAMAYAQLAGLPLQFGLYTALVPAVIGALWGSSRQLATGPVAILSLMTAAAVAPLAAPGSADYIGLVLLLTLMAGCIQLGLGLVKLGNAVNFVSHPVILGFMNAAALIIGLSQFDMLLGIPKGRSDFFLMDVWEMLSHLPLTHLPTLAMSAFTVVLLLGVKKIRFLSKSGVLVVVGVTTLTSMLIGFENKTTGQIIDVATPVAREIVEKHDASLRRMDAVNNRITTLAAELRQAEEDKDSRTIAELQFRISLLNIESEAAEKDSRASMRTLRKIYFVRSLPEQGQARFYQWDAVPEEIKTDGRFWHISKVSRGQLQLNGGGEVVGAVPAGLPSLQIPAISINGILQLMSAALVMALVAFMESISMAKAMAASTKQRIDPNQELIGQGLANIGGSFFQAYPAAGSFTGSAINLQSGAKTGFAMVFNGFFIAITLLFLTPYIYHLPKAVLAVIIAFAVAGLITPRAFVQVWKASRADGFIAVSTFVITMLAAPHLDKGVIIGALLAIGHILYRTMAPRVAILGRHEDGSFRDIKNNPYLVISTKVVAIRFDGALYFANVAHFQDAVLGAVADHPEIKYLLVVGDAISFIDSSGEEMMHNMVGQMQQSGVEVVFSGLKKQVLDVMRATGLFNFIGGEQNIYATETQALNAIYSRLGEGENACIISLPKPVPAE